MLSYFPCRFLFSGLQEDGSVLPEPASSSKSRGDSMTEWQRWPSTPNTQEMHYLMTCCCVNPKCSWTFLPCDFHQCCGGELLLSAPPPPAPTSLPSSLRALLSAGGAGGGPVLAAHPHLQQAARPIPAQLSGCAGVRLPHTLYMFNQFFYFILKDFMWLPVFFLLLESSGLTGCQFWGRKSRSEAFSSQSLVFS